MPIQNLFKRLRMERDLVRVPTPVLPAGYHWIAWEDALIHDFGEIMLSCFAGEMDGKLFPNLGCATGCHMLLGHIRENPGFCPEATWIVAGPNGPVGTIQGVVEDGYGSVQNVGVIAAARNQGLGESLMLQAMQGFRSVGVERIRLEVTSRNDSAIRLYRRLGFRTYKAVYCAVVRPEPIPFGMGI